MMKNTYKYILIAACSLASVISCVRFEEQEVPEVSKKVAVTFDARIEGNSEAKTKTILGGKMGDEYRKVLWQPGDSIGVTYTLGYGDMDKFVNVKTETDSIATFKGATDAGSTYYMFYPYNSNLYAADWDKIYFTIPSGQTYAKETFTSNAMPMVAKGSPYETLQFYSLCGVLAINLTGTETVRSISFTGKDADGNPIPIAGEYYVDMNYDDVPAIYTSNSNNTSAVTLACGDGVQLDPTEPTPFYIVLPPATYDSFNIIIATTDGKVMLKESTKPLTIKRCNVTKTGSLAYVANETINLSETGWANSYIVPESGLYSFDADIIGNGDFGLIEDADFHTDNTSITPYTAEILWQDRANVIDGATYANGQISFYTMGKEGNALIAAKDEAGNILWSWHIWVVTDQVVEHTYTTDISKSFVVMDRYLGSISAEIGDEGGALYYQWGRKDPFTFNGSSLDVSFRDPFSNLSESVSAPTSYPRGDDWVTGMSTSLWSRNTKTIYDPCPEGWKVPSAEIWSGIRKLTDHDGGPYGVIFGFSDTDSFWYPDTPRFNNYGNREGDYTDDNTEVWTSEYGESYFLNYGESYVVYRARSDAHPIRCMKDDGQVDISYPVVRITDINSVTSEGAKIEADLVHEGISAVTERGIIWGTDNNLSLDNGTKEVIEGNGKGRFSKTLSGLAHSTRYFVCAYAINERGVSYSKVKSFYTPYQGEAIDLSIGGTANSYIVPPVYSTYTFDTTVKGHTDETIEGGASVEVLWETDKYGIKTAVGHLIENVTYSGGRITFNTKESGVEGNALVAVKDAEGTILWSWHLWVTDVPAEQTYVNNSGTFIVQDRNLGATRADRGGGDEWKEACGLNYYWGRKDPFAGAAFTEESSAFSIESSIMNPTLKYSNWGWGPSDNLWSDVKKTVYDPCPVGYRAAPSSIWDGFSMSVISGSHDNGWHYLYDGVNLTWYPNRVNHNESGSSYSSQIHMTSATQGSGYYASSTNMYHSGQDWGVLRCMADEAHLDMTYPEVKVVTVNDITSESATVVANVDYSGSHEITERGIVWGTNVELDIHHGTKEVLGSGAGEFSTSLTGLAHSTRYYVRAYVINDTGIWYSKEISFYTPYEGGSVNLSANGTANCYIVPPVYSSYVFDATVKGNSTESVGTPATAEVLWETLLTSNYVEVGCVIESVVLEDGKVKFQLPFDPKPGNALVAVKDAEGTILWSWHIWVVDFDPVKTGQVYISGNMLMDRNLGALSVVPTSGNYGAYRLFYPWGRKDPFTIPDYGTTAPQGAITAVYEDHSSINPTISNPTVVYDQAFWGNDATLWGSVKTIYDPCPAGWRVPDRDVWDGIESSNLTTVNRTYRIIPEPYSTPQAYYPMSGGGDGHDGDEGGQWTDWFNDYSSWWTTEREVNMWVRWNNDFRIITRETDRRMSVRCMKEANFNVVTTGITKVTGTSFDASGEFTSVDGTEITEVGFVYSEFTDKPTVAGFYCSSVKASAGSPFTTTVSGLRPQTTYYVRAYARGGYNVKYGESMSITTGSAGNGEGFGNGGDYEWGE